MYKVSKMIAVIFLLLFYQAFNSTMAQVRLPRIIRDSMVLQRNTPLRIWGWAGAGEHISILFNGKKYNTVTNAAQQWVITLEPMKAGGPYSMQINGSNRIVLNNILVGDVWLCSGQSNMVHQMELHRILYASDIASANYPQIRQFLVPSISNLIKPAADLPGGSWKAASPEDVKQFSAVAYFFARTLYEKYKVPIGLINASVGGSPIEAWTSEEGLRSFPDVIEQIGKNKDTASVNERNRMAAANNAQVMASLIPDEGFSGPKTWFDTSFVPVNWQTIALPGYWEDQGIKSLDGVVWYQKVIRLPAGISEGATVFLGRITDADILYINGKQVGSTGYQYPQRRYKVPAGILKEGNNIFVIRVTNNTGKGGFVPDKPYYLFRGSDTVDLKGYWQYKVGQVFPLAPANSITALPLQNQPSALYNAMIAPVTQYAVTGMLWYQGESNTNNPQAYSKLLPALISDWRANWKLGSVPFLFVQLPNFMDVAYSPTESQWAALREAQFKSLSVSNTAMAVTIDLGEWNDIHPDQKEPVGERLALAAAKLVYHENIVGGGPLYQSAMISHDTIIVSFTGTGSGLQSTNAEPLKEFSIAGADKQFVWASAVIEAGKVMVWSKNVTHPLYVRYAWADNPVQANLYNREGLPASPFRTDR